MTTINVQITYGNNAVKGNRTKLEKLGFYLDSMNDPKYKTCRFSGSFEIEDRSTAGIASYLESSLDAILTTGNVVAAIVRATVDVGPTATRDLTARFVEMS